MSRFWFTIICAAISLQSFAEVPFACALAMIDNYCPVILEARYELERKVQEGKVENNMEDPTVAVEYGKFKEVEPEMEVTVAQGFNFPTLYARRKKLANMSMRIDTVVYKLKRLEMAERIIELCTKIILMNQRIRIDSVRNKVAMQSEKLFSKGMEQGIYGILEVNTAKHELFSTQNAFYTSKAEKEKYCYQLKALLGGNLPACVNDSVLPTIHIPDSIPNPYTKLRELTAEEAKLAIKVAKAESHPHLEVGYRYLRNDRQNGHGFEASTSIPIFSGRGKKALATVSATCADAEVQTKEDDFVQRMRSIKNRYNSFKKLEDKYDYDLFNTTRKVINKSLTAGRITIMDYYINLNTLYDSVYEFIDMQINMNVAAYILELYAEHEW